MIEHRPDNSNLHTVLSSSSLPRTNRFERLATACQALADRIGLDFSNCTSRQDTVLLAEFSGLALNSLGIKPLVELSEEFTPHADFIAEQFNLQLADFQLSFNARAFRLHGINDTAVYEAVENNAALAHLLGHSPISVARQVTESGQRTAHWHRQYGLLMGFPKPAIEYFLGVQPTVGSLDMPSVLYQSHLPQRAVLDTMSYLTDRTIPLPTRMTTFRELVDRLAQKKEFDVGGTISHYKKTQNQICFGVGKFIWADRPDSEVSVHAEQAARNAVAAIGLPYVVPDRSTGAGKYTFVQSL